MKLYPCELCGKIFNQKCNWLQHTKNKKTPCVGFGGTKCGGTQIIGGVNLKKSYDGMKIINFGSKKLGGIEGVVGGNNFEEFISTNSNTNVSTTNTNISTNSNTNISTNSNTNIRTNSNTNTTNTNISTNSNSNVSTNTDENSILIKNKKKNKKVGCRFCLRCFSRPDNLKRHIDFCLHES